MSGAGEEGGVLNEERGEEGGALHYRIYGHGSSVLRQSYKRLQHVCLDSPLPMTLSLQENLKGRGS